MGGWIEIGWIVLLLLKYQVGLISHYAESGVGGYQIATTLGALHSYIKDGLAQ